MSFSEYLSEVMEKSKILLLAMLFLVLLFVPLFLDVQQYRSDSQLLQWLRSKSIIFPIIGAIGFVLSIGYFKWKYKGG